MIGESGDEEEGETVVQTLTSEEAGRYRNALLGSEQEFRASWVAAASKVVIPIEEVGDLSDPEDPVGGRIVDAFVSHGDARLICMTTLELGADEPQQAVLVPCRAPDLDAWWAEVVPFDVVLVSPDLQRAVLLSVDEFALVAGPDSFVERAVGGSLASARQRFAEYAEEMREASRHLPGLAEKYGCHRPSQEGA